MAKRSKKIKNVYNPSRRKKRKEMRLHRRMVKQQFLANLEKSQQRIQNAKRINEAFDFAKSKYGGSKAFAKNLSGLLQQIMGVGYEAKAGDSNQYFEIDPAYTGKETELFKYIKFKDLPESTNIERYTEKILEDKLASPENYQKAQDEIHQKSYETFTEKNKLDTLDGKKAQMLYDIMNSSSAWNIAKKDTFDSEQVAENWSILHLYVQDVIDKDSNLLDDIIQKIENEEDINNIIGFLDQTIYKMLGE